MKHLMRGTVLLLLATSRGAAAQDTASVRAGTDSASFRFVDADLRAVIRAMAPYLRKPIFTPEIAASRVTFETPGAVAVTTVPQLLRGLLETAGFTLVEDSAFYRIAQNPQPRVGAPDPSTPSQGLHVIGLRHARAIDVAATVNALYGGEGGGLRGLSSGTLGDELRRTRVPEQGAEPRDPSATRPVPTGPLVMIPDERTNAILVRASEPDFQIIQEAVTQLDTRPLQVLIEILIVEARKDRSFDLATAGEVSSERADGKQSVSLASANPGSLVLQLMKLSRTEVSLRLSAAAARGDARIVSRPVLVVSNNAEARFLVGAQRPFVQVSRSLPTEVPVRDQVVQYRDVGTKLTVRPSISADGYVSLLVQQEMSTATDETQFGAPIISTREAATEVLVRDGQTIVLGGLTDSTRTASQSGVPLLSSIPLIGGLFGEARRRMAALEIFLFLTPYVIRTDADVDSQTIRRIPEKGRDTRP